MTDALTDQPDVIRLLADLVSVDSVNPVLDPDHPTGEAPIAAFVAGWARDAGLETELVDEGDGRPSLLVGTPGALTRAGGRPSLLLCGHLDTVGLGAMVDPLEPRIEGDRLHGRGAYDMKAGLAAALVACRDTARAGHAVDVVVACVADEEHASLGMERTLAHLSATGRARFDAAIVTEPTEMEIAVAHRGFVWTEVEVEGRAAHGSRPHLGLDAITKAGRLLTGLEELQRTLDATEHPLLGTGVVHAGVISGGLETSTIPGWCRFTVERRTLPGESDAAIEAEMTALVERVRRDDPDVRATTRILLSRPPMEADRDGVLVQALTAAALAVRGEARQVGGSYWADSALIAEAGTPTVLYGPGGEGAHADVEWVSIRDTIDCVAVLTGVAARIAG